MSRRRYEYEKPKPTCGTLFASFLFACFLATLAFFIFYPSLRTSMIDEALASNGAKSMAQVEQAHAFPYLLVGGIGFLFAWAISIDLMTPRRKRPRADFDFPNPEALANPENMPSPKRRITNPYHLKPDQFERYVARLIEQKGYQTEWCGGKGDGGIDIKVFNHDGRYVGVVQCKRIHPDRTVPPGYVRELIMVRDKAEVGTAYLASTGRFSAETRALAAEHRIKLIDGDNLKDIIQRYEQPPPLPPMPRPQYPLPTNDPHARFRPPDEPYRLPRISEQWQTPDKPNDQRRVRRGGKWDIGR